MAEMPANSYIEVRKGGYYVAGTRIGLDLIIEAFRGGRSPEAILTSYPSMGSMGKVYGVLAFILDHADAIDGYLADQERLWAGLQQEHPLPPEMLERFVRAREAARKSD